MTTVQVTSAEEMYREVLDRFEAHDIVIKAAAVADYRPAHYAGHKMKKNDSSLVLEFVRTPDILAELGKRKSDQFLVGFAAETNDVEQHAIHKLKQKNLDLIVANDVSKPGAGFDVDTNVVSIYSRDGLVKELPKMDKRAVADALLDEIKGIRDG